MGAACAQPADRRGGGGQVHRAGEGKAQHPRAEPTSHQHGCCSCSTPRDAKLTYGRRRAAQNCLWLYRSVGQAGREAGSCAVPFPRLPACHLMHPSLLLLC